MNAELFEEKTQLWPDLCQSLVDRYEILEAVELVRYDHDMESLRQKLASYKDFEFALDQRLVFCLYDTDYFYQDSQIGFTIQNLLVILQNLNIEQSYCILLTNHHGLKEKLRDLGCKIKVNENNYCNFQTSLRVISQDRNSTELTHHFCFMSHAKRNHRIFTRLWVQEYALDQTMMAWNNVKDNTGHNLFPETDSSDSKKILDDICVFVTTTPFFRINDTIELQHDRLRDLFSKHSAVLEYNQRSPLIPPRGAISGFRAPWLYNCFMNIVTETVFDYPYTYLTEKTFKCFTHHRPFVIVGAPGSLKYLKSIGFQTFDSWIDESYDSIINAEDRLFKIFDTLETVSKWSLDHCKTVYNDMLPVLEYNYRHYYEHYCQTLLQQVKKDLDLA